VRLPEAPLFGFGAELRNGSVRGLHRQ
jgi:hypothetical protein